MRLAVASSLLAAYSAAAASPSNPFVYHQVDVNQFPLAVCLDGTAAGYFVREGAAEKVILYMQGGAWCSLTNGTTSWANCLDRSKTAGGSGCEEKCTKQTDDLTNNRGAMYLTTDPMTNPAFHDYTVIFARYCDGSSFSGRVLDPVEVLDTTSSADDTDVETMTSLYFRGNYILEAIVAETLHSQVRNVSQLVIGGQSSGGMAAYLHGEQIMEWVGQLQEEETTTKFAYLIDGGFFVEWDKQAPPSSRSPIGNLTSFTGFMKDVFDLNNATDSLPSNCVDSFGEKDYFRCFFAENVIPYLTQPYFMFQADYDRFQIPIILGWNTLPTNENVTIGSDYPGPPMVTWSEATEYAQNLRNLLLGSTSDPRTSPTGVFVPACMTHIANVDQYVNITVNGVAYNEALALWESDWSSGGEVEHYQWIHDANELPLTHQDCAVGKTNDVSGGSGDRGSSSSSIAAPKGNVATVLLQAVGFNVILFTMQYF